MKHTIRKRTAVLRTGLAATLGLVTSLLTVPAHGASTDITLSTITLSQSAATTPFPGITRTVYQDAAQSWTVNVVTVDPGQAPINLNGTIGTDVYTTQTVQDMLEQTTGVTSRRPYVGVNGGFFDSDVVIDPTNQIYFGGLTGISIAGGRLLREAADGKRIPGGALRSAGTALVLQNGRPYMSELSTQVTVQQAGNSAVSRSIDGINRFPGRRPGCAQTGQVGGVCFNSSEIVEFTPEWGTTTPAPGFPANTPTDTDPGAEVILDSTGAVTACYSTTATAGGIVTNAPRGGHTIPSGGRALQGTGTGAGWLLANACGGQQLSLHTVITDTRFGDSLADTWFGPVPAGATDQPVDPALYATGAGDVLLRDASYVYQLSPDTDSRAWRTAVGTDGWGRMVLVTVEGNRSSTAAMATGATRTELAQLLQSLGLVDAVNLDGGGSTTLNMRDQNGNEPPLTTTTDSSPRHVADTVYASVGGYGLAA
jgi:hypothetical protein